MLRFEVGAEELLHSRFAISPLLELDFLLRTLAGLRRPRLPAGWAARLTPTYRQLRRNTALDAVLALQSRSYGPEFTAPPPRTLAQTVEDDLVAVRATPLAQAHREIAHCLDRRPATDQRVLAILRGGDVVDRIADVLALAWRELLAADWLQLRAICERDVVHRAGQLGRAGWAAALDDLHPRLRWRDGAIEVRGSPQNETVTLHGQGLLLIPSVFLWPGVAAHVQDPWPKTLIYPAQGIASLWQAPHTEPGALGELLGRTRARLLTALEQPASTTQLARSLGLATGAVGDHLTILRRAGLLDKGPLRPIDPLPPHPARRRSHP
ncbi:MAG: DUF5937 family protein [Frankia sp.]